MAEPSPAPADWSDFLALGEDDPRELVDGEVERLVLDQGTWRITDALEGEAVFRPASFPDLEIPLAELWNLPGGAD